MNRLKLFGYGFATAIGLGVGAGITVPKIYDHKYAKTINEAKDTIKAIAPDKFEKFQKEEKELGIFDRKVIFWLEARKQTLQNYHIQQKLKVQDSLKIDNIDNIGKMIDKLAKKAYQEGAQMVRDSIKNVSNIK